ncbi:BTB/POZ domain-containing protein 2 [Orchesella cincta]|uniref:BTB/POZ domain-containing protein 2 n=1 Tax=Orchesella cincta TaxID=48709 RepID=A0A1D2MNN5_ORCCI|nr:BTB/POZ domain-containing protein 2 [Orchesella cincta]
MDGIQAPNSIETNAQNDTEADLDETEKVFPTGMTWRKPSMDLKGHLLHMLDKGIMSDMTFLVGEGKDSIPAHRFLLTLWSKVFEEMPDNVEIPEMNVAALRSFLKYLYTEDFDVSAEDLMPVLCAAKRFEIPALAAKCVSVLKSEIKESTAVSMYQAAKLLCEEALAEESLNYILKNGGQVIQEDDFLLLSHENLCYLLERDDFEVEEVELFQAICRWAGKECEKQELEQTAENHRAVLKNAVKLIRFPLMSSKDFAIHVAHTEILTDKEMISLLIQFSIPAADRANLPLLAHGFVDRERKSSQPPKKRAKTVARSTFPDTKTPLITLEEEDKAEGMDSSPSDWRNPHAGLKFNLMSMFENHYNSDVTFVVGDSKEKVFAHKFVLALWSCVFEQMFQAKDDDEPIEITSTSASGFRSFLKVLYTENFDVSVEQVMSVFFIAKHYDVAFLGEKCVALLKSSVGDNTAVSIYQAAKVLNDDSLADIAWSYILRRGFAVVKELDFLNITYPNMCTLLEQDDLNVGETELFQCVLRWASQQCDKDNIPKIPENLRHVLKKAITLIRFPLMSVKDFSLHVAPTELLSDKEMVGVLVYYSLPPSERANAYKLAFNCKERKVRTLLVKERVSLCNMSIMSDRTISIHGFSFSGMDSNKIGYAPTSLYLYNSKKGMSYATSYTETTITNEGKDRFSVKFKMPITIRPNEWYISSEMTIGRQGASPIEKETWVSVKNRQADVNFQFQVHPLKEVNGVLEYAVPEIIFTLL